MKKYHVSYICENPTVDVTEYLRYAGAIGIDGDGHSTLMPYDVDKEFKEEISYRKSRHSWNDTPDFVIVTIYQPPGVSGGKVWAEMNVGRLRTFGVHPIMWAK